ncbi:15174_t:CDS:1, partial [Racocetra fulgida]
PEDENNSDDEYHENEEPVPEGKNDSDDKYHENEETNYINIWS